MPRLIPYAVVQSGVKRALQPDSIRRQLQRLGVPDATAVLRSLYPRAVDEFANQAFLETQRRSFVPVREESMITREFAEPWKNRYVLNVEFKRPGSDIVESTEYAIHTNKDYSLGKAESIMQQRAEAIVGFHGGSDLPEGAEIISVTTVNAYSNL